MRATGTALLPGRPRVSFSSVDRKMRRLAFVRDWSTGSAVASPQVSRSVEWIVAAGAALRRRLASARG